MPDYSTLAVHSGIPRVPGQGVGFSVEQSVAFHFESLEHGAEIFAGAEGYSYSRVQNPTVKALEARLAVLEGAQNAVAFASGQAASFATMVATCRVGDHIVATNSLFGGTAGLLRNVLPHFGIEATLVDNTPEAVAAAMCPNTRLVWAETIGNPALDIPDFQALADIAHKNHALFCVDNTWAGVGLLCKPLQHGADIVVHSLTKWAAGHGSVLGGAVLIGDKPDVSALPLYQYGSPTLIELYGEGALAWKIRGLGAQQIGMTLSPQSAHMIAQGIETLELRMQRECETTQRLVDYFSMHPKVHNIAYPGLSSSPHHALASQYLSGGFGAVFTLEVDDPSGFLSRLQCIRIAPSIGDTRTLIIHPWTTTHGRLPEAQRLASGVNPKLLRLSVGIESFEDLKNEIEEALA